MSSLREHDLILGAHLRLSAHFIALSAGVFGQFGSEAQGVMARLGIYHDSPFCRCIRMTT